MCKNDSTKTAKKVKELHTKKIQIKKTLHQYKVILHNSRVQTISFFSE